MLSLRRIRTSDAAQAKNAVYCLSIPGVFADTQQKPKDLILPRFEEENFDR